MILRKHPYFVILALFFCAKAISQNLIINGSFEDNIQCPSKKGDLTISGENFYAPTRGSTDYFNSCGKNGVGIPNNFIGQQEAFTGDAYAGLYLYSPNDYREYIQFELKEPLEEGKKYKVAIRLSLAEKSILAVQNVSVLFTKKLLSVDTNQNLNPSRLNRFNIKKYSYVDLAIKKSIFNKENWGLLEMDFIAKGYEKYITFGNFKSNRHSRVVRLTLDKPSLKPLSYYYIDDVSLTLAKNEFYELDKPFVLNKLQFKFDSFELTDTAKKDIKKVYQHLRKNPKIRLQISGHTDNKGTSAYNKYLSSRRARSVALYLERLGITAKRISWEGKGDKNPLLNSNSEKARNANRRVEFVITEFEDGSN